MGEAQRQDGVPMSMAARPPAAAPAMAGIGTPPFLGLLFTPLLCCCPTPSPDGCGSPASAAGAGAATEGLGANLEAAAARGAGAGVIGKGAGACEAAAEGASFGSVCAKGAGA